MGLLLLYKVKFGISFLKQVNKTKSSKKIPNDSSYDSAKYNLFLVQINKNPNDSKNVLTKKKIQKSWFVFGTSWL